jgi:hypothetical protein
MAHGPTTYGEFAIDCLRSDLGFWRDVDDKWVVVYQGESGSMSTSGPMYLRVWDPDEADKAGMLSQWSAAGIENCTLFDTYEEACAGARMSEYIMRPFSMARVVQLKIKVDVTIDMLADRPVNVLDALAEIKP